MLSRQFYFDDGSSRKFWNIELKGKTQTVTHGRIGTAGRETSKSFESSSAAQAATEKLVDQKVKKGYAEIDPSLLQIERPAGLNKATEKQIAKLEQQLGVSLPNDYREFLLTQNGGVPEPFFVEIPGLAHIANVAVGYLLSLSPKAKPFQSLTAAIERAAKILPSGQLPIAGDSDWFTLSLTDKPGCVYFWDHEAPEVEDEDEEGNVAYNMSHSYLLAGSFDEFLTRIARYERE